MKQKISNFFNNLVTKFKKMNKKLLMLIFIFILIVIVIITFIVGSVNKKKNNMCKELYNDVSVKIEEYLTFNNLFPTLQGDYVIVDLNQLEPIYFNDEQISGTVKYTKYNDIYIKTYNLENCGHCSSKKFGKETSEYNEKRVNMDVVTYYNYYDAATYNSYWTKFIEPEKISSEQTMGVNLPIDVKTLPKISDEAIILEYIKEDKTYYSYRDVMYKFYKNNVNYSGFSSEQPKGYTYKDEKTVITAEPSEWSLDYPEVKEYRTINKKTGYRWYYQDGKEKVYWNDGAYYPTQPDEKYDKKSKETVTMYSYTDKMWKWYNGTLKREYSSYSKTPGSQFIYKDEDLIKYTNWSSYKDESELTAENKSYREEVTKTYSRYMIKYKILSFAKLDKAVTREELESITGRKFEDLMTDENLHVEVTFKFKY